MESRSLEPRYRGAGPLRAKLMIVNLATWAKPLYKCQGLYRAGQRKGTTVGFWVLAMPKDRQTVELKSCQDFSRTDKEMLKVEQK